MPDLAHLFKMPPGTASKPAALPTDDYPVIAKKYEFGDQNKNKTPYLRVTFGFLGPGSAAGSSEGLADRKIADITKRQIRKDFYLRGKDPNDAEALNGCMFRLDEFLRACGIEPTGGNYEELVTHIPGAQGLLHVEEKVNENSADGDTYNDAGKFVKA